MTAVSPITTLEQGAAPPLLQAKIRWRTSRNRTFKAEPSFTAVLRAPFKVSEAHPICQMRP